MHSFVFSFVSSATLLEAQQDALRLKEKEDKSAVPEVYITDEGTGEDDVFDSAAPICSRLRSPGASSSFRKKCSTYSKPSESDSSGYYSDVSPVVSDRSGHLRPIVSGR